jgi:tetratricopeptide (TPR) repeat protein
MLQGRLDEALAEVDQTLALVPQYVYGLRLKASILIALGDRADSAQPHQVTSPAAAYYVQAAELLLPLADQDPTPATLETIGDAYTKANHLNQAEAVFRESLRRFPAAGITYLRLAEVVYRQGDPPAARLLQQQGLQFDPSLQAAADRLAAHWQASPSPQTAPSATAP